MAVETISIIGAGELGRQLAYLSLRAGYRTILEDVSLTAVECAITAIRETFATDATRAASSSTVVVDGVHVSSSETLGDPTAKLAAAHSVEEAARDADLVIETVADELEMKLELFTIFDKFAKPGAIFASTTHAIRISDLAEMTLCPERCIGMRLAPPRLQLAKSPNTSQHTLDCCIAVAQRMHLRVEVIYEGPTSAATANRTDV
jgi:3-hydroxybutyryl-CoA dehydrogenase